MTLALPNLFVLDFDGVICDSTIECLISSWNAWQVWQGSDDYRSDARQFTDQEVTEFARIRPFVRGAGEYLVVYESWDKGVRIASRTEFESDADRLSAAGHHFRALVLEQRQLFRSRDLQAWVESHSFFSEVIDLLKRMVPQERLYIASLKDALSIKVLLESRDISVPPGKIFDFERTESKIAALQEICDIEQCSAKSIAYVDDNPTHLISPHQSGFRAYQSAWGAVGAEEIQWSQEKQIPTLHLWQLQDWT